jgi:two-component system, OmpR family, sensor histidine kinase QseC
VDEFCDARLVNAALAMDQLMTIRPAGHDLSRLPLANVPVLAPSGSTPTNELEVGYRVLGRGDEDVAATENFMSLKGKPVAPAGFSDTHIDGRRWRLFRLDDPRNQRIVVVGERHDSRRDILRAVWIEHTLPLVLGLPLLGWLATWSVERVLAPLSRLAEALARRAPSDRDPIAVDGVASELEPLVASLNQYLLRANDALEREGRLSADVAHELRTPISVAMINVDGALEHVAPSERAAALPDAMAGIRLLQQRSEELLTLARLDDASFVPSAHVALACIVAGVVEDMAPEAAIRAIALTSDVRGPVPCVRGDEPALRVMLRNLVANALRHAPVAGNVTVGLEAFDSHVALSVTDDGPGIPADRRDAVFQRFLRNTSLGDGFGLGLSIVHRVVRLHRAVVALQDGRDGRGLCVVVRFAHADATGAPPGGWPLAPAPPSHRPG